jgi:hypothetical protein
MQKTGYWPGDQIEFMYPSDLSLRALVLDKATKNSSATRRVPPFLLHRRSIAVPQVARTDPFMLAFHSKKISPVRPVASPNAPNQ